MVEQVVIPKLLVGHNHNQFNWSNEIKPQKTLCRVLFQTHVADSQNGNYIAVIVLLTPTTSICILYSIWLFYLLITIIAAPSLVLVWVIGLKWGARYHGGLRAISIDGVHALLLYPTSEMTANIKHGELLRLGRCEYLGVAINCLRDLAMPRFVSCTMSCYYFTKSIIVQGCSVSSIAVGYNVMPLMQPQLCIASKSTVMSCLSEIMES